MLEYGDVDVDSSALIQLITLSMWLPPGARFSKVPKLYGPLSGVTIPFVSQERGGFKSSNFTVIFLFVTLKTRLKIGSSK